MILIASTYPAACSERDDFIFVAFASLPSTPQNGKLYWTPVDLIYLLNAGFEELAASTYPAAGLE